MLDHLHGMAHWRSFQDLHHQRSGCRIPIFDRFALEGHLELIQSHQLKGERALQEAVAIKLDGMSIQRRMDVVDRAVVCPGNGVDLTRLLTSSL